MKYKICKLSFSTAVHFGSGRLSDSDTCFRADTLFSALCIEALKIGGKDLLDSLVKSNLRFSDGMPYLDESKYYIPKPIITAQSDKDERESNSNVKKAFKKLKYLPADKLDDFFDCNNFYPQEEVKALGHLGKYDQKTSACVADGKDTEPYYIGTYKFEDKCGLYVIIGCENDDEFDLADDLLYSLGYTGIGGKVSAGLGKFTSEIVEMPAALQKRFDGSFSKYMTLSVCMAKENELESAVDGAEYSVIKRSGFVYSYDYADSFVKKRDFYCFAAGSCFSNKFDGDIFDVGKDGNHSVYRYAKPLLMGVM